MPRNERDAILIMVGVPILVLVLLCTAAALGAGMTAADEAIAEAPDED